MSQAPTPLSDAEEYALFGYPHTTEKDCAFLCEVFSRAEPPVQRVLDIACGLGRHAIEMTRHGYEVTAVDVSADMLAGARAAAEAAGAPVTFHRRDMRAPDFTAGLGGPFDGAYILFNTLLLLAGNDALIRFMRSVHAALRPGGRFVLEVANLWGAIAQGQLRNDHFSGDETHGDVRRHRETETVIGPHNAVMAHHNTHTYRRGDQTLPPKVESHFMRITSYNELDLLCRLTGFEILELYGDTDVTQPLLDPGTPSRPDHIHRSYVPVLARRD